MRAACALTISSVALVLTLWPSAAAARPAQQAVRMGNLPGMHLRIAVPVNTLWHYQYQLRNFRPYNGRYSLQGLFTTVTVHQARGYSPSVAVFTVAFLQDPQRLPLWQYINAYLGGARQYHLMRVAGFGNASEAFRGQNDSAAGGQRFFMRSQGHVYWFAWNQEHGPIPGLVVQAFPAWQFTT